MKVLWTWSTSAECMRQRRKFKEWIIMEPFYNIVIWAIIQRTFGHDLKVIYTKWSKGPSSGHFYAAATDTLLIAQLKKTLLSFRT